MPFVATWKSAKKLQDRIELFWDDCKKNNWRPTIQRLALFVNYASTQQIWEHRKKGDPLSDVLNKACLRIESELTELCLSERRNVAGPQFILRSMGLRDTQHVDLTSDGKKIESSSAVVVNVLNESTNKLLKQLENTGGQNPRAFEEEKDI